MRLFVYYTRQIFTLTLPFEFFLIFWFATLMQNWKWFRHFTMHILKKGQIEKLRNYVSYIFISACCAHKTMCYSPSYNINRLKSFVSNWYRSYKFSIYGKLLEFAKILSPSKSGQDMSANKKWFLKGFVTPPSKMLRRPFNI